MQPNPPAEEPNQGTQECTLCHRIVLKTDVNSTGRCSECAGKKADEDAED